MQIKVKRRILFDFLKKRLNENRTNDNPSGNFISPLSRKDDSPIKPSPHMSVQLSVEEPPVDDPYYVPATVQELIASLSVIAKEVPQDQIDYFYRQAHKLLDDSLDMSSDLLSEGINLLTESETMMDKLIQRAADKVKMMMGDSESLAIELIENYPEFEGMEVFDVQMLIDNAALASSGVDVSQQQVQAPRIQAKTADNQIDSNVVRRKKKEPELQPLPVGSQVEDVEDFESYHASLNKNDYLLGFDVGLDVDAGLEAEMPSAPSKDFMSGYEEAIRQGKGNLVTPRLSDKDESFKSDDPVIQIVSDTHDILFDVSRAVEREYFNTHFTKAGREARESGIPSDHLNQTTRKFGITNDFVFTHLNLTKKKGGKYYFTEKKIEQEVEKFINKYIKTPEGESYNQLLLRSADHMNVTKDAAIGLISKLLAKKYEQERAAYDDVPEDEYLEKKITTIFSTITKKKPYEFKNVSRHFMNRATQDQRDSVFEDMLNSIAKDRKGDQYIFKSGNLVHHYPAEQIESEIDVYVKSMFDQASEYQNQKLSRKARGQEIDIDDDFDERDLEAESFAKKIAKLGNTTNFDNLAPFFGFSSASGLRQWYLKHALRKIKALGYGSGGKNQFAKLYEQTLEALAPFIIDSINDQIKKMQAKQSTEEKDQQKLMILKHALPQLEEINRLMLDDRYLKSDDSGNLEGQNLLYTVGGHLLRTINSEIYKPIMNLIDKDWTNFVAEVIVSKAKVDFKKAKSLAEYFTGKKEIPNYETMTKAAKNLLAANIDFDMFKIIVGAANDWFDDTLETEFSTFDTGEDKVVGEFLQAVLKSTEKLFTKPKDMEKAVDKAVAVYLEDIAHQIAFRNLSQYETESGD